MDGFSGFFYGHCWDVVAQDVYNAVREFFIGVPIPKSIASTLIVLNPKKEDYTSFVNFRPISNATFSTKFSLKCSATA